MFQSQSPGIRGENLWSGLRSFYRRCKERRASLWGKLQLPLTFAVLGLILWGLFRPGPDAPLWEALPEEDGPDVVEESEHEVPGASAVTEEVRATGAPGDDLSGASSEATAAPQTEAALCRIYLTGGVRQPGVYALVRDALLVEAVEAAGGLSSDALADRVNLASVIQDQGHYHIPREGEDNVPELPGALPEAGGGQIAPAPLLVDLNRAGSEELQTLPGIGPGLAQRILDYREANGAFARCEELMEVPGIKEAKFDGLKDHLKPLG